MLDSEICCGNVSSRTYKALVQWQAYGILVAGFLSFPGNKRPITLTRTLALSFRLRPTQVISLFACPNLREFQRSRSRIRASWYNYESNQQDALYRLIYYSKSALHVSGDVFAHHQEHLTVFTVSGSFHPRCCRLVSLECSFSVLTFMNPCIVIQQWK